MGKYLIRHYGKYIYRHEDYRAICQGDDCASQILSLFEFWTSCRIEEIKRVQSYNEQSKRGNIPLMQPPDLWLYETTTDISDGMLDAYGDSSIRKSLKKLIAWEFIDSRKSKNDFDRTKEYRFNTELIQSSLDQWWNAQSTENSEAVKTTYEPLEKTLETVKRTYEPLEKTYEPLNLQDDLYSLNSLNKQSLLTGDVESEISNPNTQDPSLQISASLITKAESSQPTNNSTVEAIIPSPRPASSHNKADEQFTCPRDFNSAKGTYKSGSSDPWMATAHNPDKGFSEWVFSKRYKDKPSATLADAKAEIRNSWERASDLWDEYQSELLKKQQQRIEIVDPVETEPYKPPQNTGHRMTEEARNAFKQKLAAK